MEDKIKHNMAGQLIVYAHFTKQANQTHVYLGRDFLD